MRSNKRLFALKGGVLVSALALVTMLGSSAASAAAPFCTTYAGQGYCQYTGRVYQAYINSSGQIILNFDTLMDANAPSSVGIFVFVATKMCLI